MNHPSAKNRETKQKSSSMTEDMRKSSTHGDASSWDTDAFDAKVRTSKDGKWKGKESKKTSRVQDISMSLESGHEPVRKGDESWPFESSPCHMFGGKNTKGRGNSDAVNNEIFKTEFEIKKESKTESDDSEEDDESEISDSDDDDGESFGEESEEFEMQHVHEFRDKIKEEAVGRQAPKTDKASKRASSSKGKERSSLVKTRSGESLESTGNRSQDRVPVRRSLRRSDSDRRLSTTKSARDELGGSCHPNIESKNDRRSSTKKTSSSRMLAATTHGDKPTRKSRGVSRVKSSDGLEGMRSSRGDGLASSKSCHDGEGRLRSSRRSTKSTSKTANRRGGLTRAMSTKNVKPPEQYSSSRSSKDGEELKREKTDTSSGTPEEQIPKKSSRPGVERKSSQRSMRKLSEKSSGTTSKSQSRRAEDTESEDDAVDHETKRRQKSSKRGDKASEAPRRDLLVLLREQKTVTPTDLMDKENRRSLHFLAFEHKMGISFKELRRSVSADA